MSESKSKRNAVRWNRGKVIKKNVRQSVCFSVKGPADMVLKPDGNDGTYLFDNGFIGQFVDEAESFDPGCWDDDVIGAMYINLYGPAGEYQEGDEYPYREGMTLGELCEAGGLPKPKRSVPEEFYTALEDGALAASVFDILNRYLNGVISEEIAVKMLGDCRWPSPTLYARRHQANCWPSFHPRRRPNRSGVPAGPARRSTLPTWRSTGGIRPRGRGGSPFPMRRSVR